LNHRIDWSKETFKYHMTLREEVCSKPSEYRHMGRRVWPNRHIAFIEAKKLNLQFILLYLRYMWGEGLVEKVIWEGWLKTSEYRHMEGGV